MSSSAEVTAAAPPRPAQWPWVVLAGFLAIAGVALVLVVANDEAVAEQIPYVIAFAMFGVVGAFIVSRDRRNRIGILFLWASFITAISFLSGELLTYVVNNGESGWWVVAIGFLNNFGWLLGILPTLFLLPLLFPDGHLPSPRWRPLLWFIFGLLILLASGPALRADNVVGFRRRLRREPLVHRRDRQSPELGPADRARLPGGVRRGGRVADPPIPALDRRRASTDQVGGVRIGGRARRRRFHELLERGHATERLGRGRGVPHVPALGRDRRAPLPPLRP